MKEETKTVAVRLSASDYALLYGLLQVSEHQRMSDLLREIITGFVYGEPRND